MNEKRCLVGHQLLTFAVLAFAASYLPPPASPNCRATSAKSPSIAQPQALSARFPPVPHLASGFQQGGYALLQWLTGFSQLTQVWCEVPQPQTPCLPV